MQSVLLSVSQSVCQSAKFYKLYLFANFIENVGKDMHTEVHIFPIIFMVIDTQFYPISYLALFPSSLPGMSLSK